MIWAIGFLVAVAAAYQLAALLACLKHLLQPAAPLPPATTGVSILKPVHGLQSGYDEALKSHAHQDHPLYELLIGYNDPRDASIPATERALALYPATEIRHFVCPPCLPNRKAGVLQELIQQARYPWIIVNDADIAVPPGYIQRVTAPLNDPGIGLVTCLYRAEGDSWPTCFEALGVATDFAAGALVAPLVGVSEFGFGSTLAFRRQDLEAIGGFPAVGDHLADDYQLGAKIRKLGRRNLISPVVVTTRLHARTWAAMWKHQVRWARTIRLSRTDGYLGLPVTFATLWALLACALGFWPMGLALLALRLLMAVVCGWFVIGSPDVLRYLWLVPIRDLFAVFVWAAGLRGSTVEWGGRTLQLDRQGRIIM